MPLSNEMRRLDTKWQTGNAWPKRLEWLEMRNMRGWSGQRISFNFPIVAVVGENGSGKSTILQAAACAYQDPHDVSWFPSEFFPETAWDTLRDVRVNYGYKQGDQYISGSVRKPTTRWLGQPERPERRVEYIDLSRLQPVGTRVGYARIAKSRHAEASATDFVEDQVHRLSEIMGRRYDYAKMALSDIDQNREIPVLAKSGNGYSGFHQGSGETTIAELIQSDLPRYGLILIDEIESSLHPRAQRRLMRDLATKARIQECQIILTTHSPYVLEELPLSARTYILETDNGREIVNGVSPQFAMTKMDDEPHPECELYVEDIRAAVFLAEILSKHARELLVRCSIVPYGAANLGVALGELAHKKRFVRPTTVFLDGDQDNSKGCVLLPGDDAPERVVFGGLQCKHWKDLWTRVGRDISSVSDACSRAMVLQNHHEWVQFSANQLMCGGDVLWQSMCAEWAGMCPLEDVQYLIESVQEALNDW
ncbi:MAG: AAA family ATPase [Rhodospirillaceae bacterium]|nr:AAA family ATPase [Rhodospirillaceae bacterium]